MQRLSEEATFDASYESLDATVPVNAPPSLVLPLQTQPLQTAALNRAKRHTLETQPQRTAALNKALTIRYLRDPATN